MHVHCPLLGGAMDITLHITIDETTDPRLQQAATRLLELVATEQGGKKAEHWFDFVEFEDIVRFIRKEELWLSYHEAKRRAWGLYQALFNWTVQRKRLPLRFVCSLCKCEPGWCRCAASGAVETDAGLGYQVKNRGQLSLWQLETKSLVELQSETIEQIHKSTSHQLSGLVAYFKKDQ